jgi:ATP-binding cassette, subfamily B, bacterial
MRVPLRRYFTLLWHYLAFQKLRFSLLTLLLFGGIGLQLTIPQFTRFVIDTATGKGSGGITDEVLIYAALAFIGVAITQQLVMIGASYLGEVVAWAATNELRTDLMRHCLGLDLGFHHATNPGTLIERIDGDVSSLADFFAQLFVRILGSLLLTGGILIVLFIEDGRIGAAFFAFTFFALFILYRVRNIALTPQKELRQANTQLSGFLEERLAGIEDLRSSGADQYVINGLLRLHTSIRQRWTHAVLFQSLLQSAAGLILTFGYVVTFVCGYYLYNAGTLSLGGIYLVMNYMTLLNRPLTELSQQVDSLQNVGASIERVEDLLNTVNAVFQSDHPRQLPSGSMSITFDTVQFAYKSGVPVLIDVSFSVEKEHVLGIVGRTGSGKSTIARLLMRFYDPQVGKILLNDIDISDLSLRDLRQYVGLVTQEVQLFAGTIRDNLTFFNNQIPDSNIHKALELFELGDWLHTLPNGLDTAIEAGGAGLSAGEAQLLAFARAMLHQPSLVILDEASSRLDPITEAQTVRATTKLLKGRTGIIIAHRLETLKHANHILILENARVIEYGERIVLENDPQSHYHHLLQLGEGVLS